MLPTDPDDPLREVPACKNCQSPLWEGDRHCADCGQKVNAGPPTLWALFGDFFESLFNLDNRVFLTLRNLFIPGRLTNVYLAGRQRPFLNPLRFFFFMAAAMLGMFTILVSSSVSDSLEEQRRTQNEQAYRSIYLRAYQETADSIKEDFADETVDLAIDSLVNSLGQSRQDSTMIGYLSYENGSFTGKSITISTADFVTLSPLQILDKYEVTGWFNRYQAAQIMRIQNMGTSGVSALMGQLVWGLLLLMPCCAILLKLFYIRRKRLFVEHFIFSLHVHSFICLLLTVATVIYYFQDLNFGYWMCLVLVPVYFYVALLRVYRQGWFKTFVKMILLFFGYQMAIVFCASVSSALSVLLF